MSTKLLGSVQEATLPTIHQFFNLSAVPLRPRGMSGRLMITLPTLDTAKGLLERLIL